jgi:hypothetical protein
MPNLQWLFPTADYEQTLKARLQEAKQRYKPEPYEQVLEVRVEKRRKSKRTPLSPQTKAFLTQQNMARTQAHESNLRLMNKMCDSLENWATQARYG